MASTSPAAPAAATTAPVVSPLSPAVKRSMRKRQRPTFFAEEMITPSTAVAPMTKRPSSTRNHARTGRQQHPHPHQQQHQAHAAKRVRSDLSQLHDTVASLRSQIESAATQMQELRAMVTTLADLYRAGDDDEEDDEDDAAFIVKEEDLLRTPLSPMLG